jgi:peptidyl-tRNA hydrolase
MLAPGLTMTAGKAMAQVGHAAQLGWWASSPEQRQAWQDDDFATTVRPATPAEWSAALAAGAPVVHDAGFTEVAPNSATALFLRAAAG